MRSPTWKARCFYFPTWKSRIFYQSPPPGESLSVVITQTSLRTDPTLSPSLANILLSIITLRLLYKHALSTVFILLSSCQANLVIALIVHTVKRWGLKKAGSVWRKNERRRRAKSASRRMEDWGIEKKNSIKWPKWVINSLVTSRTTFCSKWEGDSKKAKAEVIG